MVRIKRRGFFFRNAYEKGAETRINVAAPIQPKNFDEIDAYEGEETVNIKYLKKIMEHCKENNIEILLTYNPFPAEKRDISSSKYVQKISEEYNINYINFLNMDIVNYATDCYDKNSHLNASGARKVTDYLGTYIMQNYNIPDRRNDTEYQNWYQDYDEYIDFKIENLKRNENNLNNYLMLLYNEQDISYSIKISTKKYIEQGSTLYNLLQNINNNYEINDKVFKEHKDKTIYIATYDKRNGKLINTVWL